ncbi:MAG: antitoxin VapB family protein [Thermoplasmata archaeon]
MSSRNIAVQSQVYEALDRERRGSESFTSLLRRLLKDRQSLEDLAGAWGGPSKGSPTPKMGTDRRRRRGGTR